MGVGFLVAFGAFGHHAHPVVLIADAALGDVLAGLAVVGELVGAQELVAAAERDVAGENGLLLLAAVEHVAEDVGRQGGADLAFGASRRGIRECGDGVLDRTQPPIVLRFRGHGRQGDGDAQRQRKQAGIWAHVAGPDDRNGR